MNGASDARRGPIGIPNGPGSSGSDGVTRFERGLLLLLAVDCIAVFAIWALALAQGAFAGGLFAYVREGTVPIFHLTAEFAMAIVTLVGLWARWRKHSWGRGVLLFGLGMLSYSAVNSLGWALHEAPATAIPMVATLALALLAFPVLLREPRAVRGGGVGR